MTNDEELENSKLDDGMVLDEPERKVSIYATDLGVVVIHVDNEEAGAHVALLHDEAHDVALALLEVVRKATISGTRQAAANRAMGAVSRAVLSPKNRSVL